MSYTVVKTDSFLDWYYQQSSKSQVQIEGRITKIENHEYFGDRKRLDKYLWELRWKNGRRIYYGYIPEQNILFILGGNKNGQKQDIEEAKNILGRYTTNYGA